MLTRCTLLWSPLVLIGLVSPTLAATSPLYAPSGSTCADTCRNWHLAQFPRPRPDFFDVGQEQFEQEVQRLQQQQQTNPVLTIDSQSSQWQPVISRTDGFSIWMPPGVLSQESKTLNTTVGTLEFKAIASQQNQTRYVAAVTTVQPNQSKDPTALFTAVENSILASAALQKDRDRSISLGTYPGRELQATSTDEILTFRFYLVQQRLYLLATRQLRQAPTTQTTNNFFDSFQLLKN